MKSINKGLRICLAAIMMVVTAIASQGAEPAEVLNGAVSKIKKAPGVTMGFSASGAGADAKGTLRICGTKFKLDVPGATTWYDGKTMWTANHKTHETTMSVPDRSEMMQVNPMSILNNWQSQYRVFFSKNKAPAGKYRVLLNPRVAGSGIKAVEILIDGKNSVPEHFIVRRDDDSVATILVTSSDYSVAPAVGDFSYPKTKYPNYQLIDLR